MAGHASESLATDANGGLPPLGACVGAEGSGGSPADVMDAVGAGAVDAGAVDTGAVDAETTACSGLPLWVGTWLAADGRRQGGAQACRRHRHLLLEPRLFIPT
jgi:hypothetical protein